MFVQNNRIQDKGLVIRLELSSHADSEGEWKMCLWSLEQ